LILDLGANDDQLDFLTVYAIAKQGTAKIRLDDNEIDLSPLLDTILEHVAPASSEDARDKPLLVQTFNLGYDNYLGRLAIGRIYEGNIKSSGQLIIKTAAGETRTGVINKLFTFEGINRKEVDSASAGDIIMIAGLSDIYIGETICENEDQEALPAIDIDEPTISLNFLVNNSPFAGREGKYVTNRQLRERLEKELEINVGLKIDFSATHHYRVLGRGDMHIAIFLENIRREGFELQISQPHVIIKEENGKKVEPFEEVTVNVPEELTGVVIEKLAKRKGNLLEMKPEQGGVNLIFEIPSRGLLGYKNRFIVDTKGEGIMYSRVIGFRPHVGPIERRRVGSMISMNTGKALGFSLFNLQNRGSLYIGANIEVYEGMVIGNTSKGDDLTVNPIKGKQLSNMRASGADEAIRLTTPIEMTLEKGMSIMHDDEYFEITPKSVRLRKQFLNEAARVRAARSKS
ncbi:MAG: translational GTPase TypA, partial [Bacteroidetes bacterium]|nr:translational GTPase TypA [Bacteroidota bacterium]